MSVQTGTPSIPHGPPSSRTLDRAKHVVRRARHDPNPIWVRELRQAARLHRTPIILMLITLLVALTLTSIGGIMIAASSTPAKVGFVLFHVFFSVAYFLVTWVGPALAANSIASEREGHTWEPLLLTGLSSKIIARGKFLAVFTSMSLYVIALLPVGALPFLFGGVTATEVLTAFVALALVTLLSVSFGLAVSAAMPNGRASIIIVLLISVIGSVTAFSSLGFGLSAAAHGLWPAVVSGAPIWLPTAYQRAPFSFEYVSLLVALPLGLVLIPTWFFYELTVANLAQPTDDRTTGIKRWFALTMPLLAFAMALPIAIAAPAHDADEAVGAAISTLVLFVLFCVMLFQGDAIGPSRKVLIHWERRGVGPLTRWFGPGLLKTMSLVLIMTVAMLGVILTAGATNVMTSLSTPKMTTSLHRMVWLAAYAVSSTALAVALASWIRVKSSSITMARFLFISLVVAIGAVPWIIAVLGQAITGQHDSWALAAPSPLFVFRVFHVIGRSGHHDAELWAGASSVVAALFLSGGFLVSARMRGRKIIREYQQAHEKTSALLADEDAAPNEPQAEAPQSSTPFKAPPSTQGQS